MDDFEFRQQQLESRSPKKRANFRTNTKLLEEEHQHTQNSLSQLSKQKESCTATNVSFQNPDCEDMREAIEVEVANQLLVLVIFIK